MSEIDYLRDRARACRKIARATTMPRELARLEACAADFDRQALVLEARLASRK
jgi:hypothetical protein